MVFVITAMYRALSLIFIALGAMAQQPAPDGVPGAARVEGSVANAATGEPIKRVNIVVMQAEPRGEMSPYTTTSDATGRFAMTGIAPGRYRIWAERTGYVRVEHGARRPASPGSTVSIAAGQVLKGIDFRLQPHSVIAGRVTDPDGEPLAHVQVRALQYRYMQGKRELVPAGNAGTNDLGEYRIFGLPPGKYFVSATSNDFRGAMYGGTDRTAVRNPQGEEGYAATYYPGTNDAGASVPVEAAAGRVLTNIDIRLMRTRTVRVRGRVTNAGTNPAERPVVMLVQRNAGMGMMMERNLVSPVRSPDGTFEIRGVTPNSYDLIAQLHSPTNRQFARMPIEVGAADVEGIEITLSQGLDLTGVLRVEGQTQIDPATIRFFLEPAVRQPFFGGGMSEVKSDGSLKIASVMPETYRVRVFGGSVPVYVKSVSVGDQVSKDNQITVLPGVAPVLNVVLSTAAAQIGGVIKNDKDEPVRGATVVLLPEGAKREQNDLVKFSTTDQSGRYNMSGIAPGRYKLFAWDVIEMGQWSDPEFVAPFESRGKAVTVEENAKLTEDLPLLTETR